jgi:hypothetical protein
MSTNKKFRDACTKSISSPNWSHHIKTKKHKNKELPQFNPESITIVENDTNSTIVNLPEKTKNN